MKRGNLSRINGFVTSLILIVQSFPVVLSCDKHYALDPDGKPIVCTSPFASPSSKKRRILSTQINDGYCDCPTDGGYDELLTGACSGSTSGGWAGIPPENPEMDKVFICPQQLDLQIPLSRVRDGICDCCDGSDESSDHVKESHCHDVCDELFKGQREERDKIRETRIAVQVHFPWAFGFGRLSTRTSNLLLTYGWNQPTDKLTENLCILTRVRSKTKK